MNDSAIPKDDNASGNYNEDELQDILSEIEDLESDFVEGGDETLALAEANNNTLQGKVDDDIDQIKESVAADNVVSAPVLVEETPTDNNVSALNNDTETVMEEAVIESDTEETIVANEAIVENTAENANDSGQLSKLTVAGQMDINLSFDLGHTIASIDVTQDAGLALKVAGVNVLITKENGCTIEMSNGVKFSIPLK